MELEIFFAGNKKVNASFNGFVVKTDQPINGGGNGDDPSPFELFLASLGTCAGIFVKSFCDQRNLPTDNIKIIEHIERDPAKHTVSKIGLEILLPADFPEKYRNAVISAADLCTVKRLIQNPPEFDVYTSIA
jgi:ribosomal protein S12 methylthiotransferase accessory factor